jgi:hypothetical protein
MISSLNTGVLGLANRVVHSLVRIEAPVSQQKIERLVKSSFQYLRLAVVISCLPHRR